VYAAQVSGLAGKGMWDLAGGLDLDAQNSAESALGPSLLGTGETTDLNRQEEATIYLD